MYLPALVAACLAVCRAACAGALPPAREAACPPLTAQQLLRVLGGAYNSHYMAVRQPAAVQSNRYDRDGARNESGLARGEDPEGFAVPVGHRVVLGGGRAAWLQSPADDDGAEGDVDVGVGVDVDVGVDADVGEADADEPAHLRRRHRRRRRQAFNPTPWACEWRVLWTDLGVDYFPRFLRSVECEQRRCWYDRFECRPRSFAVKVLRRMPGQCAPAPPPLSSPSPASPAAPARTAAAAALAELWLWEERDVAFCCECAPVQ